MRFLYNMATFYAAFCKKSIKKPGFLYKMSIFGPYSENIVILKKQDVWVPVSQENNGPHRIVDVSQETVLCKEGLFVWKGYIL